jgi:SAM-dependent methyltransferase
MIPTLKVAGSAKASKRLVCAACGENGPAVDSRLVRCNVRKYRDQHFHVKRCGQCFSLQTERVEKMADYYVNYPIREQKLGYFFKIWYGVILKDLVQAGLKKEESIVDYGCNQGLFLDFLKENGYTRATGFDPFVERYNNPETLQRQYDWVISMDTIEHDENPVRFVRTLNGLRKPTGRLCITTPRAEGINLDDPEGHLHMLHVPYHINILSEKALVEISRQQGLAVVSRRDTFYMDSWQPGTSYYFIKSLMAHGGNDVDLGYESPRISLFLRHPSLFVKLFFGYFLGHKKKDHMMIVLGAQS